MYLRSCRRAHFCVLKEYRTIEIFLVSIISDKEWNKPTGGQSCGYGIGDDMKFALKIGVVGAGFKEHSYDPFLSYCALHGLGQGLSNILCDNTRADSSSHP